ncbi:MAG TPA: uridine kinase [Propionibacteriaceae bacterium]|nr:uridine kinase [Propionibacteriaceae bacterium]HQE30908.1 uridine kinase [Propionibacteriaceae bacterium]
MEPALVLVAGESGSGKSHLARISGCPRFRLDEYYLDGDAPNLPQAGYGIDWDHPDTWDGVGALDALEELVRTGRTVTPEYDISTSKRIGRREIQLPDPAPGRRIVIVAEGIFAPEIVEPARARGLEVTGIWLYRPPPLIFLLRLVRDLRQHRKPPIMLLRRGLALLRSEPGRRRHAQALGCTSLTMTEARREVERLATCPSQEPPRATSSS